MSVTTLMTAEEFQAIPDPPDKRFELIRGRMVEYPLSGALKGWINGNFVTALCDVEDRRRLGHVFGDGVGYIIARNPDSVRIVDVSFVPRWRFAETGIPDSFCPFAPDLAVEIVSSTDDPDAARARIDACLDADTRLAWIADVANRTIAVITRRGVVGQLTTADDLDGGDVLPGFRAHVEDLFSTEP